MNKCSLCNNTTGTYINEDNELFCWPCVEEHYFDENTGLLGVRPRFLNADEIPINSIWMSAGGGSFGHKVEGKLLKVKDIIVRPFVIREGVKVFKDDTHRIDFFKLQYRYSLVEG